MFDPQQADAPLTEADLTRLGGYVAGLIGAAVNLGHASPADALVYAGGAEHDPMSNLCLAAFAATRPGDREAQARLLELADRHGLTDVAARAAVS